MLLRQATLDGIAKGEITLAFRRWTKPTVRAGGRRDGAEERVLEAARRAGLDPPFSCEEGYCSCCMARLVSGRVVMATNDCLTRDLLEEGWVLTCQSRCVSREVRIEYPE
jgi:ferredoxin